MPSAATKTFVLDTSVLLYNANSIRSFGSKNVVIPYVVLEELDKFKTYDGETGRNARQVARDLNNLRVVGKLSEGVEITPKGGVLRIELDYAEPLSPNLNIAHADDRILNICLGLQRDFPNTKVILVSKDINLVVRADVFGVEARDFDSDKPVENASDIYTGTLEVEVLPSLISAFYADKPLYTSDLIEVGTQQFFPNQYLTMVAIGDPSISAIARVDGNGLLQKIRVPKSIWGIAPKNREQLFAIDALMNKDIPLVSLSGAAGTGKTIISLACALEQVQEHGIYDRLIISRPVQPMGKDIGYLPGTVQEKLDPWMGPLKDTLNVLTDRRSKNHNVYSSLVDMGAIEIEALTYIRGRSLPNTLFFIDEVQDLSKPELKTIVSRMGENSKLVLIGDILQISNPYLDPTNNGLSNVIEKFKSYDIAAHVTLTKGERSRLATIASNIL